MKNTNGCINSLLHDLNSVITGYGKHERVIAFLPDAQGLYCRVDLKYNLPLPTHKQILTVARKDQDIKGRWNFEKSEMWDDGSSIDYYFTKARSC